VTFDAEPPGPGEPLRGGTAPGALAAPASSRRPGMIVAAIVVVVAVIGAGLAVTDLRSSDHPAHWDRRLGDLPASVARLRGLEFDHPVPVRYESAARFVKERALGTAKLSAAGRRAARRATESLRAMGLVSGAVDLAAASRAARESRVLAFYDPDAKEVVIRGGTHGLDVPHRVVLAHELTHVLQDQHFGLNRLERAVRRAPGQSPQALRAVVEGYVAGLSAHDRATYRSWQRKGSDAADRATAAVPAVVSVLQTAPYTFGPLVLEIVAAEGGNRAVDRVFEHGVFTQQLFVEPTASLTAPAPKPLVTPEVAAGEKTIGAPDELGAFDLYLLLASRLDGSDALVAAGAWAGGRSRTVRADGRTCVRGVVTASTPSGARELSRDLELWAGDLPTGMATVRAHGRRVTLHSCDPGPGAGLTSPDAAITRAQNVLAFHNQVEVSLVRQTNGAGIPLRVAKCAALEFVRAPEVSRLLAIPQSEISAAAVRDAISAAAPAVRDSCGV
jgi:hypothetical protein